MFRAWLLMVLLTSSSICSAQVDFRRDIQPILAEHCSQCHGVDDAERQGGLRLDRRDDALRGGDSGEPAIRPQDPDGSAVLLRVTSTDPDLVMPPPHLNKPLTSAQVDALREWIAAGAEYAAHWAFVAPEQPVVPTNGEQHPIDALVRRRLESSGLSFSPAADAATLNRRLSLDLIGLPPSIEEQDQFGATPVEATIDRLLASPRFGEKWARHWLDLARYSDTNGYEKDLQREQWAWRDWVIESLNADQPYDQFLIQQLAGDLLPDAGQNEIIATGFLRNSMINEEGAIVPEQFRMVELFDRMDCIGKATLGLSLQCAQCHTHKFDPLTQDEYFGIFAFLNDTYEAQSWVYTPQQLQQLDENHAAIERIKDRIRAERPDWSQQQAAWEASVLAGLPQWTPIETTEMGSISGLNHPTQEADKSLLMKGHTSADVFLISATPVDGATGLQLEALPHRDLPHNGPGRSRLGTWEMLEVEVFTQSAGSTEWQKVKLVNATADYSEPLRKSGENDKKSHGPVSHLIDGSDDTSWNADRGHGRRNAAAVAVVQFEQPLTIAEGGRLKIAWRMTDMLGCARFSLTTVAAPSVPAVDHGAVVAMQVPDSDRSELHRQTAFEAWCRSVPELQPLMAEVDAIRAAGPVAATSILHLMKREASNHRPTHLMDRGNWDQPRHVVLPATPAALNPFPADAPRDRLGLALWLTDRRSPLTARVAVNQVWQALFGTGLVETSEDFGTRAPLPEHLEVLDWLAVDFMNHGWSRKHLIRTIVTSRTYQQSSRETEDLRARDPRNRLLARGPRFRADAEVVRDIVLTASGLIHHELGGPGVIPPVPQNVLDYNYTYPSYWTPAAAPQRYRRSVYLFRKRSMPDPVMSVFDSPNADVSCARRVRSNTPLAALTGLNEPVFVEASRALALRVLREAGPDEASRTQHAWRLCTSRAPTSAETAEIMSLLNEQRQRLSEGWLNPRAILSGDPATLPQLPDGTTPQDAAAWTLVARVLLNLDETVTRN
jgi:hypothetical protein